MSSLDDQAKHIRELQHMLNAIRTAISTGGSREPVLSLLEVMLLNISSDTTVLNHAQGIVRRENDLATREIDFEHKNNKLQTWEAKLNGVKERNDARVTAIAHRETAVTAREHALITRERNFDTQIASQLSTRLEQLDRTAQRFEGLIANPATITIAKKSDELPKPPKPAASDSESDRPLILSSPHRSRVQQRSASGSTLPTKRQHHAFSTDANPNATESKRNQLEAQRAGPSAARQDPQGFDISTAVRKFPRSLQDCWDYMMEHITKEDQKELIKLCNSWQAGKTQIYAHTLEPFIEAASSTEEVWK
ncbi:MAG: hypothetical protein Q9169_001342 [Polycauliona sp. 2 TL-2023]